MCHRYFFVVRKPVARRVVAKSLELCVKKILCYSIKDGLATVLIKAKEFFNEHTYDSTDDMEL